MVCASKDVRALSKLCSDTCEERNLLECCCIFSAVFYGFNYLYWLPLKIKSKPIKPKHFVLDKKRQQSFSLVYKCRELCSAVWVHVALSALSFD